MEDSSSLPEPGEAINPAVWAIFTIGVFLFVFARGTSLISDPIMFFGVCLVWGGLFGFPAHLRLRYRKRGGLTAVAALFLLAAGVDAAATVHTRYVVQPRAEASQARREKELGSPDWYRPVPGGGNQPNAEGLGSDVDTSRPAGVTPQGNHLDFLSSEPTPAEVARVRAVKKHTDAGLDWLKQQEHDKAIESFDAAIRISPNAHCYSQRGYAWYRKADYDRAIKDFDAAIRMAPSAYYHFQRGMAWYRKQNYDEAIKDYDEAIRLDPGDALYYNGRGNARSAKKEFDQAEKDYGEANRLDPKQFPK